jgi:hypothetical protein
MINWKWNIIPDKLKSLRFLIFFLLLVYSGFYMLTTTSPVWFVLVTMLAFKLSDELDKW